MDLVTQLQMKIAELKSVQGESISTDSTDDSNNDEFDDEPVYNNTEDETSNSAKSKPGSYETHFINSATSRNKISEMFQEESEEDESDVYVTAVCKYLSIFINLLAIGSRLGLDLEESI